MTHPNPPVRAHLGEVAQAPQLIQVLESRAAGVPGLGQLTQIGRHVVARQTAEVLGTLLDFDLLPIVEAAWRTHDRLTAAGYRTAAPPGGEEVVEIGQHRVVSRHRPSVKVNVNGAEVATIEFALVLQFDISALVAVVRRGALVAAHPGRCELSSSLSCEDVELPVVRSSVALPGVVDLGEGFRLVPDAYVEQALRLPTEQRRPG